MSVERVSARLSVSCFQSLCQAMLPTNVQLQFTCAETKFLGNRFSPSLLYLPHDKEKD